AEFESNSDIDQEAIAAKSADVGVRFELGPDALERALGEGSIDGSDGHVRPAAQPERAHEALSGVGRLRLQQLDPWIRGGGRGQMANGGGVPLVAYDDVFEVLDVLGLQRRDAPLRRRHVAGSGVDNGK